MTVNVKLLVGQITGMFVVFALLLFVAAGTAAWAAGWAFLILFFGFTISISLWLLRNNPSLLTSRMEGNIQKEQKTWDKVFTVAVSIGFVAWMIVMPLDAVRFRWTSVPDVLQVVGAVMLIMSFYLFFVTFRENSFLAPVVRVQEERGHTVVSTGPYHVVRHPMYAAFVVFAVGTSLLLGSWYGLLLGLVLVLMVARRAVMEEGTLRQELQGYDTYMTQVKYRLIPYIW